VEGKPAPQFSQRDQYGLHKLVEKAPSQIWKTSSKFKRKLRIIEGNKKDPVNLLTPISRNPSQNNVNFKKYDERFFDKLQLRSLTALP